MPMPKKRHSNVRQGKRRFSNYRLASKDIGKCPQCGEAALPHHACPSCGTYKGRTVIKKKDKKEKKEKKGKKEKS
jgi:large subunit ribosomal protein L32